MGTPARKETDAPRLSQEKKASTKVDFVFCSELEHWSVNLMAAIDRGIQWFCFQSTKFHERFRVLTVFPFLLVVSPCLIKIAWSKGCMNPPCYYPYNRALALLWCGPLTNCLLLAQRQVLLSWMEEAGAVAAGLTTPHVVALWCWPRDAKKSFLAHWLHLVFLNPGKFLRLFLPRSRHLKLLLQILHHLYSDPCICKNLACLVVPPRCLEPNCCFKCHYRIDVFFTQKKES
jgi:hypothetical protein